MMTTAMMATVPDGSSRPLGMEGGNEMDSNGILLGFELVLMGFEWDFTVFYWDFMGSDLSL